MLSWRGLRFARAQGAQSIVETALILPLMLTIVLNAANFGYFFFIALNLASAPHMAALYSIQGGQTPAQLTLPSAALVEQLAYDDIRGSVPRAANAPLQVCSKAIGLNNVGTATQTAQCQSFNGSPSYTPATDPEAPVFVLQRVDMTYTVTPLVKGTAFNLIVPTLTFHRQASMRAMD